MQLDKDLASIQEARNLVKAAKAAQAQIADWDQERVDSVVEHISEAGIQNAAPLAEMAVRETGFGVARDKVLKNLLAARTVHEYIRDMKTVGMIREDMDKKIMEVAVPVGVVAALIPSTNPTSTTIFKSMVSVKAGNAIIISPHPNALNCILETVRILREALRQAGAPEDLVQCIQNPTVQATDALMKHPDTGLILATGGNAMVHAAYSSGNPAIGVGAGNGPAFIERSADIPLAVKRIFDSKTFDNGTICASEQSIVTERCIRSQVEDEVRRQGGYFLSPEESERVGRILLRANGSMNPAIVGQSAQRIAEMAGVQIPEGIRVMLSEQTQVGERNPYSREKLCPVLGFYVEESWEQACARCMEILHNEGIGHTMTIHSTDESIIRAFALKKPVMRLLVNAAAALGGVGAVTGLAPSFTLGCGAAGNNATSDNITPLNLFNIRRVAWGIRELEELRGEPQNSRETAQAMQTAPETGSQWSRADVERIAAEVISYMTNHR